METKKCLYCGKEFVAKQKNRKWCSVRCHDIVYRMSKGIKTNTNATPYIKICTECGKEFETFRDATVTCSHECSMKRKRSHKEKITKKCVICGVEFETNNESLKTCGSKDCIYENKKKSSRIRNYRERERKKIERKWYKAFHTVERECKVCGTLFYCLDKEPNVTCSKECSKKWASSKKEKRINKENLVDADITLEKLFKRDNGVCYLCGGNCDFSDHRYENGNHYTGDNYPTIEHVVPLALGGKHMWENVRLAHFKCNVAKGITTPTYTKEMAIQDARKYAREISQNKKKTAQYTLDGHLVRIWDSTAQIKRELGLSDKHIQNVCRLHDTKTGNAYGFHWEYVLE